MNQINETNQKDQPDQDTHSHGRGHRHRHSHSGKGKWKQAKHWLKKHFWRKYRALFLAIVLGLLVAKYCVPVDF
jgi:hypothetical protein